MKNILLFPFLLIGMICLIVYAWWPEKSEKIGDAI
jgi:hypothetical protein